MLKAQTPNDIRKQGCVFIGDIRTLSRDKDIFRAPTYKSELNTVNKQMI